MLTTLPAPADDVVAYRLDGKVTDAEFDQVVADIEAKLERHDKLRAYGEYVSFSGMPIETFIKDLRLGLKHWNRFSKAAVVTDRQWVKKLAEVEGTLLPGLRVKAFPAGEEEAAMAWLLADA